jgi:hypothetical protein
LEKRAFGRTVTLSPVCPEQCYDATQR